MHLGLDAGLRNGAARGARARCPALDPLGRVLGRHIRGVTDEERLSATAECMHGARNRELPHPRLTFNQDASTTCGVSVAFATTSVRALLRPTSGASVGALPAPLELPDPVRSEEPGGDCRSSTASVPTNRPPSTTGWTRAVIAPPLPICTVTPSAVAFSRARRVLSLNTPWSVTSRSSAAAGFSITTWWLDRHDRASCVPDSLQEAHQQCALVYRSFVKQPLLDVLNSLQAHHEHERREMSAHPGEVDDAEHPSSAWVVDEGGCACHVLEEVGKVFASHHGGRAALLESCPDGIRADTVLGVGEPRGEHDPVKLPLQMIIVDPSIDDAGTGVSNDDRRATAGELLSKALQDASALVVLAAGAVSPHARLWLRALACAIELATPFLTGVGEFTPWHNNNSHSSSAGASLRETMRNVSLVAVSYLVAAVAALVLPGRLSANARLTDSRLLRIASQVRPA